MDKMEIGLYQAIDQMRMLTREGKTFSFTFMTYSMERRTSHGLRHVDRARLVKRTRKEHNRYGEYMIDYIDLDSMQRSHFWQPLLVGFNGMKVTID